MKKEFVVEKHGPKWWYVMEVLSDGTKQPYAGFTTKKAAVKAMEGYKENKHWGA